MNYFLFTLYGNKNFGIEIYTIVMRKSLNLNTFLTFIKSIIKKFIPKYKIDIINDKKRLNNAVFIANPGYIYNYNSNSNSRNYKPESVEQYDLLQIYTKRFLAINDLPNSLYDYIVLEC